MDYSDLLQRSSTYNQAGDDVSGPSSEIDEMEIEEYFNDKSLEFIIKARVVHGDRYDYSLVDYQHSRSKVKIFCWEHGIFEQTPNNHISHMRGCNKCVTKRFTTEDFIEKAQTVHGDKYDYSLVDYQHSKLKIKIICQQHGLFEQRANNHLEGQRCSGCVHLR